MRISADKSKAIAEMATKYSGDPAAAAEKSTLRPTGRKEMIYGYEAEEYVRESASLKESYWIALQYPDSAAIVKQLQSVIPTAWNEIAKGMLDYRDFPGLPLRTIIKTEGKEVISTITAIKRDPLSEAEFSVPKDFQELTVPNLQEILGDKPATAPSTKPDGRSFPPRFVLASGFAAAPEIAHGSSYEFDIVSPPVEEVSHDWLTIVN